MLTSWGVSIYRARQVAWGKAGQNMKIAMIGHKRIPSREGGVEIVVEELSVRMAAMGHEVTAYNRKGEHVSGSQYGGNIESREYRGVRLLSVPTPQSRNLNAIVYSFLATLRAVAGGYHILHYHAEGPGAMLIIPKLLGIRTVATVHGLDWQRSKWGGFATKYLLWGEKMIARHAGEVIVLSENVRQYFKEQYGREVNYIPNAINPPVHRSPSVISDKYGLDKDGFILFLARLVPEKGLHYLLEAFRKVDTQIKLVVAGGGSHSDAYVKEIQELATKDERVIMTGFVQGEELDELYSNCFMYVLPSDVEGMPLTLLEAMSYGCRCLTSDIPENVSVTKSFAHAFRKADQEDLREKLQDVLSGKITYPPPEEIMSYITAKYNWDEVVEKTLALYEGLQNRARGRS